LKAIVLAGGLGTRLKPFTEVIPKPLLPIGEKSVLEIQISESDLMKSILLLITSQNTLKIFGDGSRCNVK
jgi:dTDP-glucose pyrophosphorylase